MLVSGTNDVGISSTRVEYAISRDGGLKASCEQKKQNVTHLGVKEIGLETVNTFASVEGGDKGSKYWVDEP